MNREPISWTPQPPPAPLATYPPVVGTPAGMVAIEPEWAAPFAACDSKIALPLAPLKS